jgi:N utilization substance protein A
VKSDFTLAFNEIVETRALPREKVLDALTTALESAYRRDAKVIDSQAVKAELDIDGQPRVMVEKEVVEDVMNPQTEVLVAEAREVEPNAQEGDMVMVPVKTLSKTFGRIAAQTAKQVILQHIREAEREALYSEYIEREGDLITGTVQSISSSTVTLDLGRAEAVMPPNQRTPTERYRPHEKIRVYVAEVKKSNRGPQIIVSRNHKNMLRRLLEYEVPEIYNGQIDIKSIAREAGHRSKVAVAALQEGIDAVGACVGMRGMRIQNIVRELNDEKIDIIEWDADPARFIARALSPARVTKVFLEESLDAIRTATVIVPEDQLSLAIGKEGQNARLAAKLTGWRIDIKSVIEAAQDAMDRIEEPPLVSLMESHDELLAEAYRILEKKAENRVVTPEEYTIITDFVELAEGLLFGIRDEARSERREMIEGVRPLVPPAAFLMPLAELELADDIMRVIDRLGNVGELWIRFMGDESGLAQSLREGGADSDAMDAIRDALDDLVLPEILEEVAESEEIEEEPAAEASVEAAEAVDEVEAVEALDAVEVEAIEDAELPVDPVEAAVEAAEAEIAARAAGVEVEENVDFETFVEEGDVDEDIDEVFDQEKQKSKKKAKQKRRQLIFDEEVGEVVAKRRRKRGRDDGDDYDEFF